MVGALVRVSLLTAMQYRSDFVFNGLTGLLRSVAVVGPLLLVFVHRDEIAGWSIPEAMLVIAMFLGLQAFTLGLMEPNLGAVVEHVRKGTLDLVLMKPADAQLLTSISRVQPARLWDLLAAVGVGAWALARLPSPSALDVAAALVMAASGLVAMYGLWVLAICTSFFFVRVDNLRYLLMSAAETGRWPLAVFTPWLQWVLTVVVPVGVITTFPAMALRGTWSGWTLATAVAVAAAFALGSRVAWTRSLASYTSASS